MKLDDLQVYQIAMKLGDKVWEIVLNWDYFAKDTTVKQLVKAIDSIAANISEGFGRYHYGETKQFGYYSRGSLNESITWLTKAFNRKLISDDEFRSFMANLNDLGVRLNNYIRSIGTKKPDDDNLNDN
jgi:four helix bundle protein